MRTRPACPGSVPATVSAVAIAIIALLACGGQPTAPIAPASPTPPPPPPPAAATGSVEASVTTSGVNHDPNGYSITLNGTQTQSVGVNGSVTFRDVPVGQAELEIAETEFNCRVIGDNPRTLSLVANGTAAADFQIHCVAPLRERLVFERDLGVRSDIYSASRLSGPDGVLLDQRMLIEDGMDPAVSPDGTMIAFVTFRDLNREIYVASADGAHPINLTRHPGRDREPVWSPDGTRIAFVSSRGGIFMMNVDGSGLEQLTFEGADADRNPAWSPDGDMIAFESTRGGGLEIHTLDFEHDPFERCGTTTPPVTGSEAPVSGSRVTRRGSARCVERRTFFGDAGVALTPTWRVFGPPKIVFAAGGANVESGIYELAVGASRVDDMGAEGDYFHPVLSRRQELAVWDQGPLRTVLVFQLDNFGRASGPPRGTTGGTDLHPSWSP